MDHKVHRVWITKFGSVRAGVRAGRAPGRSQTRPPPRLHTDGGPRRGRCRRWARASISVKS
eukprot:3162448-Prymnesium_polylepis.1